MGVLETPALWFWQPSLAWMCLISENSDKNFRKKNGVEEEDDISQKEDHVSWGMKNSKSLIYKCINVKLKR